jgi:hypothetical protein
VIAGGEQYHEVLSGGFGNDDIDGELAQRPELRLVG